MRGHPAVIVSTLKNRLWVLGFFLPFTLFGQAPAVYSVYPQPLSPGVRATLIVAGIGRDATVSVNGRPAAVLGYTREEFIGEWLDVQIPVELIPGAATLEVISGGVKATPVPVTIEPYSPEISSVPADCSPGRTLKAGDTAVLYAIGLGPTEPIVPTGIAAPVWPPSRTLAMPKVMMDGQPVDVLESVLEPGEIGLYRLKFKVPAGDGFHRIELGIGGKNSAGSSTVPVGNVVTHGSPSAHPAANRDGPAAPDSIVSAYPCGAPFMKAGEIYAPDTRNGATALGGIAIKLKDSQGVERTAPIVYASPRVDYVVPSGTAEGPATVTLSNAEGIVSTGTLYVQLMTPRLFKGFASAPASMVVRVREGVSSVEQVIEATPPFWVPIDLGPETDQVYLALFGTGMRHRRSADELRVVFLKNSNSPNFFAVRVVPEYAGAQPEFAGVDQINVRLPRSLAGSGFLKVLVGTVEQISKWPATGPTGPDSEGWSLVFK